MIIKFIYPLIVRNIYLIGKLTESSQSSEPYEIVSFMQAICLTQNDCQGFRSMLVVCGRL